MPERFQIFPDARYTEQLKKYDALRVSGAFRSRGFTLIEVLVVMTVLAILATIAVPNYSRYVTRGNLVEATNSLSEYRVRMEQFYQDARSYQNAAGECGALPPANLQNFGVACVIAAGGQAYTATATGAGSTAGFIYSINQANARATVALPSHWGTLPSDAGTRWVTR
jgi:type IV pilus assembly protein PilE